MTLNSTTRSLPARLAGVSALLAGMVLGACESTPFDRPSPAMVTPEARAAATPIQHEEYAKLGYRVDWRGFPTMTPGYSITRLDPLGDVVVVQEGGSVVTVLETGSGAHRWSDPVDSTLTKFVGTIRDGKRLIVSSESVAFMFDIETGALLTKQNLALVVNTKPVQVGPILIYGCSNGQVLGHLMANGFKQWGSFVTGSIEADPIPVGNDGTVGLVSERGDVLFLDGESGLGRGRGSMFAGTNVPLAASDIMMFVASVDHSLYAFNRDGASQVWRKRTEAPLMHAPVYHEGRVYCDMGAAGLTCLDAISGDEFWSNKNVHGTAIGLRKNRLLVWDGDMAKSLDPARGSVIESVELKDVSLIRTDNFVDGNLYLAAPRGVVTRLVPRN